MQRVSEMQAKTGKRCVGRGSGGGRLNFSFSDISNRCDASEGKLINLFLIIYIFEKDKVH